MTQKSIPSSNHGIRRIYRDVHSIHDIHIHTMAWRQLQLQLLAQRQQIVFLDSDHSTRICMGIRIRSIHHIRTMAWLQRQLLVLVRHQRISFLDSDHSIRICMGIRIHDILHIHIHTMAVLQRLVWPQALLIRQQERELQSKPNNKREKIINTVVWMKMNGINLKYH